MENERKSIGATAPNPPQVHRQNATRRQPVDREGGNERLNPEMREKKCAMLKTESDRDSEDVELSPTAGHIVSRRPAVTAVT